MILFLLVNEIDIRVVEGNKICGILILMFKIVFLFCLRILRFVGWLESLKIWKYEC